MGITELLTVAFVVLKILGYIDWNWFFVLLPEIIALVPYSIVFILVMVMWLNVFIGIIRR